MAKYSTTWDLDTLFKGGSQSTKIQAALNRLKEDIQGLDKNLDQPTSSLTSLLSSSIEHFQAIEMDYQEIESFIGCLVAQNIEDQEAIKLSHHIGVLRTAIETISEKLNGKLQELPELEFKQLISSPSLHSLQFILKERRSWAKEKLPLIKETIMNQLARDGYRGWSQLYSTVVGYMRIPFREESLSIAQAENKLAHPDRSIRSEMFQKWQNHWKSHEATFAQILNHLAGFRLQVYQERGWSSILKEPLFFNRMKEETLNCMWSVIAQTKDCLKPYLSAKAKHLGLSKLSWFDVEAPLVVSGETALIPFDEAADRIIHEFSKFSPRMGNFAQQAFDHRWIEVEDRSKKLPGGFCSQHPASNQSRIFMTYSGTMQNIFTLAHELGHAYHNYAVKDLPVLNQQYRMNVAETASTLAEAVLVDSILKNTKDPKQKLAILDSKLQRAVIFLMNIHARFLFEKRFYEARKKGFVVAEELNQLMEEAQKEAYGLSLEEWYPHFWISKAHFYNTETPFYNFPYTFGYLFSLGLYAIGTKKGLEFENSYESLLKDTGVMQVEELAQKHLGVDLTKPNFWQSTIDTIKRDVELYTRDT